MSLHKFPDEAKQVDACTDFILLAIRDTLSRQKEMVIAVSGGKSPIPLFKKISLLEVDFSRISFTLVDDRIVATTHEDSNEHLVKTYLLKNNAAKAKFTGLVNTQISQDAMLLAANKLKHIDLAILGMGDDGHTASIFPDCSEVHQALDLSSPDSYIITNPLSAKYSRISMTLSALIKIPTLILNIDGNTKLKVFNEALRGDNLNYPVSYVLSHKPDTQIFWHA